MSYWIWTLANTLLARGRTVFPGRRLKALSFSASERLIICFLLGFFNRISIYEPVPELTDKVSPGLVDMLYYSLE